MKRAFASVPAASRLPDRRDMVPVWGVIVLCCLVEALLLAGDLGLFGLSRLRETAYGNGALWPGLWRDGQPNFALQPVLMVASYALLHGGLLHLTGSMALLLLLGGGVALRVGPLRFLAIYGCAVLGGAAACLLAGPVGQPVIGSAGGLFGLAGAVLAWVWADAAPPAPARRLVRRAVLALIAIEAALILGLGLRLDWPLHLGGFLAGGAAGIALDRRG